MNTNATTLTLALTTAMTFGAASAAHAASPFAMQPLAQGYMVAAADKAMEGKCGGNAKAEEGKCGGKKSAKTKEGKCGEGKCGGNKAAKDKEGKCGGMKAKEGKCGGAM